MPRLIAYLDVLFNYQIQARSVMNKVHLETGHKYSCVTYMENSKLVMLKCTCMQEKVWQSVHDLYTGTPFQYGGVACIPGNHSDVTM